MNGDLTDHELESYLDEALPAEEMARIEAHLRDDPTLLRRLAHLNARRDQGAHTIGAIWRRQRLTCPDREQLGAFLLGALDPEEEDYLEFHLRVVGCRVCQANLEDLRQRQAETEDVAETRRRRYFNSSAGYLGRSQG